MLIELRLIYGKMKLKNLVKRLGVTANLRTVKVMHLTLYGDFHTDRNGVIRISNLIRKLAAKYDRLPFLIDGIRMKSHPDGRGHFAYFNVVPSKDLAEFRKQLSIGMQPIARSIKPWDSPISEPLWHISISLHKHHSSISKLMHSLHPANSPSLMDKFFAFISGKKLIQVEHERNRDDLYLPLDALRITLLGDNRRIVFEYDLPTKQILPRNLALNRQIGKKSLSAYRSRAGLEAMPLLPTNLPRTFVISDLHLSHDNIIIYCARPFIDSQEMNSVLIDNWNRIVQPKDKVYFLGDMAFGRGSNAPEHYLSKLNGDITFIKGNHDSRFGGGELKKVIEYCGKKLMLVHDSKDAPSEWKGWIIHGHNHNNELWNFPFINGVKRTINVSAELIKYQPLDLDKLIALDFETIKRMDTVDSVPVRF